MDACEISGAMTYQRLAILIQIAKPQKETADLCKVGGFLLFL